MMFAVDAQGCLTDWSKEFFVLTRFHREEVLGMRLLDFITYPFCQPVDDWMQRAKDGVALEALQIPFYTKPGERVDIMLKAVTKNQVENYMVECLLAEEHEDSPGSEAAEDGSSPRVVVSVNKQWRVTGWNAAAEEWTLYFGCEVMGRDLLHFITSSHRDQFRQMLQQASCGTPAQSIQIPFYTKAAEKLDIQFSARANVDDVVVEGQVLQSDCHVFPRTRPVKTAMSVWTCPTIGSLQSLGGATSAAPSEVARESFESATS
eukprot:TRINITY_DN20331_c0_g1_i1.p1 TRINITY_DN20331_c0_g1~~TRINITY_DN20331_c0_g1_i1.p1  ORF type:complete len:262 (+),score=43.12 TRINITY_DN20331_c0_g1_i1:58-843(+)